MQTFIWQTLSEPQQSAVLTRPAISSADSITIAVSSIIADVRTRGDDAVLELSRKYDGLESDTLRLDPAEIQAASARLSDDIKQAIEVAYRNITTFHQAQIQPVIQVETMPGVVCEMHTQAVNTVGLYIPGGTAPLPSTVLMLGIPAQIAGCSRRVLCSPPDIADEILFAAGLCGIDEIYTMGGAQAVAALAYGTQTIAKVDKIFGPGNAFVTEAKRQVSNDFHGAAIDMPAGPSEVLVIADSSADPAFIAADLLSQAEHGIDSQSVLLTPDYALSDAVRDEVTRQVDLLPRADIARQSLAHSMLIVCEDMQQCIDLSNFYAPEHLIVQTDNARELLPQLANAGSIFLGAWTPESVGDYASGTNHVLPTYGYTRTYSSLGLADFTKRFTVQELTAQGLLDLAPTVEAIATAETLDAHRNAVTLRVNKLRSA